jgi:hypothetical protein
MPLGPWPFGEDTHFAKRNRGKLNARRPPSKKPVLIDGLFAI